MLLAAWLHDLSPFIIDFGNGVGLRWYGLAYAAGFMVGWLLLRSFSLKGLTPLSPQRVADAMLALIVGVVAGGRLGYCLFYQQDLLADFSTHVPFWGVLRLTDGGMSSHGGMIGVIAASWWIARGVRTPDGVRVGSVPWAHVLDLTALACTPGLFFGRLANFVNGELLGRIAAPPGSPAPWWSVKFPQEAFTSHAPRGQDIALAPILEAHRLPGEADFAAWERVLRTLQSGTEASRKLAADLDPLIAARHPSQLYQAVAEGLVLGAALLLIWRRPRRPGVIGAWFLILYGVLRVATEFVRLPDAHLHVQRILGLSRGQWLSVLMVVVGVAALSWVITRPAPMMFGGWARKAA